MIARNITAKVLYDNKDISADLLASLKNVSYSDNMSGEADTLDLTLEDRKRIWQNEWFPEKGATLNVSFIEEKSGVHDAMHLGQFEIDELASSGYPSEVHVRSISIPNNNALRGIERTRSWEKAKLKDIANDVAKGANVELFYDVEHNPTIERAEQTEQSDLSFLLQLTNDHGLALKIHEKKIVIFSETDYEKEEPKINIVKPGAPYISRKDLKCVTEILSYSFKNKVRDIYKACRVKYQQGKNKAKIEAIFTDSEKTTGKTLEIREQVENHQDAERLAKQRLREKNKEEWTGSISVVGDFNLVAAITVNLEGFGAFDGKYIVTRVSHNIGNGYTTDIEIRRCLNGY